MKICFLGAGAFGKALADVAQYNGHEVNFYDPFVFPEIELKTATKGKDLLVYVAPSEKAEEILPQIEEKDTPLICASKGFLSKKPFESFKDFSALGGAAFSDMLKNKEVKLTASSEAAEQIFSTEKITIEYTKDTLGILLCGALKNIYAVGAGAYKENQEAEDNCGPKIEDEDPLASLLPYLQTAAAEMQEILKINGADPETLKLSCGLPDLILSSSDDSRNFRFGRTLISGEKPETATVEGKSVIKTLKNQKDFKIPEDATLLKDIIKQVKNAARNS